MTEQTNETQATETATVEAAPVAKVVTPSAPKLTLSFEGKDIPLLKYAFPVKAAKFPVKVNGAVVDAACTEGRGKAYTYLLINNTSFYVPGILPVDADVSVNFPADYKFDEAQSVRVSTYKPKVKKDAAVGEGSAAAASESAQAGGEAGTAESSASTTSADAAVADDAPKAARRSKK